MTIEELRNKFPLEYNDGITLYLDDVLEYRNYEWYITFHDNENYKYQSTYHHINSLKNSGGILNKFFKRNPFTYDNINNFCRLNDIDLNINGTNLPVSGYATEKLNFKNNNGDIIVATWNQVQHYTDRYKRNYSEILLEKKKTRSISKEEAIKIIFDMQSKLDRPIDSRDFRKKQEDGIGIRIVLKYWKEVRFMQEELGLTVTGKYAHLLSDDECLEELKKFVIKYMILKVEILSCMQTFKNMAHIMM